MQHLDDSGMQQRHHITSVSIMSLLQARTSRRSNRSRRQFGSTLPADSSAGLRHHPSPNQARPRRHALDTATDHAARSWTGDDRIKSESQAPDVRHASGRARTSARRRGADIEPSAVVQQRDDLGSQDDAAGAHATAHEEHQPTHGRSLRSRSVSVAPPSARQVDGDRVAQLAHAWQDPAVEAHPGARPRRSTRAQSQAARSQEDAEEGAGPSRPASALSPISSRETRAQQRSVRSEQADTPDVSPEPEAEALMAAAEGEPVLRRSYRQHTHAALASVGVSHESDAAHQRSTGIKVTLRQSSGATRQLRGRQIDEASDAPSDVPHNGRCSGLRVSLRSRRA